MSETVSRGSRRTPVVAYVPNGTDRVPLIVFAPGFQTDSNKYDQTVQHLASYGFVVVRATPPNGFLSVSHTEMRADIQAVIDWAVRPSGPVGSRVDSTRIGVMGHSLGGKVSTMTAAADPRVAALLALDPVNGGNPLSGYSSDLPNVVPDPVNRLTIPVGWMGQEGDTRCAPTRQNYRTFFDASTSVPSAVEWTFTGADHLDFTDDPGSLGAAAWACGSGAADQTQVVATVRSVAAAFFLKHLAARTDVDASLTGQRLGTGVTTRQR